MVINKINSKQVTVGIEFSRNIVSNIPDGKEYYSVLHEFSLSKVAATRKSLDDCLSFIMMRYKVIF